jgi:hypothetical protein
MYFGGSRAAVETGPAAAMRGALRAYCELDSCECCGYRRTDYRRLDGGVAANDSGLGGRQRTTTPNVDMRVNSAHTRLFQ